MSVKREKPFEYLRMKDGVLSDADKTIVENWYIARAFVLDKLKGEKIGSDSTEHLHVVVNGDSPLMLSVVRQVALSAHYTNYDEATGENRTIITLVSSRNDIVEELKKEEYLCKLLDYCKYSFQGITYNEDSYIDVELEIVEDWANEGKKPVKMEESDISNFLQDKEEEEIYSIDTRKAVLAERMYHLGELIDNLPAEDIHCASRYAMALDIFRHDLLNRRIKPMVNEEKWKADLIRVKESLSNVFCADCFESRAKGIEQYMEGKKMGKKEAWEENNEALSKSEHARWVVEKLIMGYRPLKDEEKLNDEQLFGKTKKDYRNNFKKNAKDLAHIDLCSYADLRRIKPEDMKYDSFLMLAIPQILKIVNG